MAEEQQAVVPVPRAELERVLRAVRETKEHAPPVHFYRHAGEADVWALEDALQSGGWISCAERLPAVEVEVLVHDGFHQRLLARIERDGVWRDTTESMRLDCVTHWQPMPALPKEAPDPKAEG